MVGHAQGHGPARLPQVPARVGPHVQDEGQRPGPKGPDERPGGGGDGGDGGRLSGVGDQDRRRHAPVPPLGGQEPTHARGVGGQGPDAVDGVGGENEQAARAHVGDGAL